MEDEEAGELDVGQFARIDPLGVGSLLLFDKTHQPPYAPVKAVPVRVINLTLQFLDEVVVTSLDNPINLDLFDARQKSLAIEQKFALLIVSGDLSEEHYVSDLHLFGELADHLRNLLAFFRRERLREDGDSLHIPYSRRDRCSDTLQKGPGLDILRREERRKRISVILEFPEREEEQPGRLLINIGAELVEHSPEKLGEGRAFDLVREAVGRKVIDRRAEWGEVIRLQFELLHKRVEGLEWKFMLGAENQKLKRRSEGVPGRIAGS